MVGQYHRCQVKRSFNFTFSQPVWQMTWLVVRGPLSFLITEHAHGSPACPIYSSTSDHGFALGENGHVAKHHLYDVEMRVPLGLRIPPSLTHDPNLGRTARNFVSLLDLYPTVIRLANVSMADVTSEGLQGTDLFETPRSQGEVSTLETMLTGTSLEGSYPQNVYPLVENMANDVDFSDCTPGRNAHPQGGIKGRAEPR